MTLLSPLGLLGLIGVIILIIIYIIKPNFQQKVVSSTFVWKLSLKYRKKKIPTSKLRDLLLILCQTLIIASCAMIIAQPACIIKSTETNSESVIIIDSSASMLISSNGKTRYDRAIDAATKKAEEILDGGGEVTVITAGKKAEYLCEKETKANKSSVLDAIKAVSSSTSCSYGSDDIDGAMALCAETVADNPKANVFIYTDAVYAQGSVPEGVNIVDVKGTGESNTAILSAKAELYQNYYVFTVEVARYGSETAPVELCVEISGVNALTASGEGATISTRVEVPCLNDNTYRVIFRSDAEDQFIEESNIIVSNLNVQDATSSSDVNGVWSFTQAMFYVEESDGFDVDNYYYVFGGKKEEIKIEYVTTLPNNFIPAALELIKSAFSGRLDITVDSRNHNDYEVEGYDMYIFEHFAPDALPTDGVTFLFDPKTGNIIDANFTFGNTTISSTESSGDPLTSSSQHQLLKNIDVSEITVSEAYEILYYDEGEESEKYEVLMELAGSPIAIARNNGKNKTVVFSFSIHYSNIAISRHLITFMYNLVDYYFPATVSGGDFAVNEKVDVNARGETVTVTGGNFGDDGIVISTFPTSTTFELPGAYQFYQKTCYDKDLYESIYVSVPSEESKLASERFALENPFTERDDSDYFKDLLTYIAAALVALLFLEWWLQARESM